MSLRSPCWLWWTPTCWKASWWKIASPTSPTDGWENPEQDYFETNLVKILAKILRISLSWTVKFWSSGYPSQALIVKTGRVGGLLMCLPKICQLMRKSPAFCRVDNSAKQSDCSLCSLYHFWHNYISEPMSQPAQLLGPFLNSWYK